MSSLPEPISALISALNRLPGVGPRSAERIALHLSQAEAESVRRSSAEYGDFEAMANGRGTITMDFYFFGDEKSSRYVWVKDGLDEDPATTTVPPRQPDRVGLLEVYSDQSGRELASVRVNDATYQVGRGDRFATSYQVISLDLSSRCGRASSRGRGNLRLTPPQSGASVEGQGV